LQQFLGMRMLSRYLHRAIGSFMVRRDWYFAEILIKRPRVAALGCVLSTLPYSCSFSISSRHGPSLDANHRETRLSGVCFVICSEQETIPMANEPETTNPPQQDQSNTVETPEQNRIDRIADQAAAKARNRQNRVDQEHGSFPRGGPSGMA
jgi:hypothetical protein